MLLCNFIPIFLSFLWACALLCAISHEETMGERTLCRKAPLVKQMALVTNIGRLLVTCCVTGCTAEEGPRENEQYKALLM